MKRNSQNRYIVTGPGIADGEEPSYADLGPAISRMTTAALFADGTEPVTFYTRDAITDSILGHAERDEKGVIYVHGKKAK